MMPAKKHKGEFVLCWSFCLPACACLCRMSVLWGVLSLGLEQNERLFRPPATQNAESNRIVLRLWIALYPNRGAMHWSGLPNPTPSTEWVHHTKGRASIGTDRERHHCNSRAAAWPPEATERAQAPCFFFCVFPVLTGSPLLDQCGCCAVCASISLSNAAPSKLLGCYLSGFGQDPCSGISVDWTGGGLA